MGGIWLSLKQGMAALVVEFMHECRVAAESIG